MKRLALALLVISLYPDSFRNGPILAAPLDDITLSAEQEIKGNLGIRLRGNVQVNTASVTVYADEAEYNPVVGTLDARGHVRVAFKKGPRLKILDSSPEDAPANFK